MAELPSGTVTFLFTDLEGSTRLWEERPEAMRDALARHDEILCSAITSHGGHVVKMTGDGVHAVFGTAHDALDASADAQRLLAAQPWDETGPLKVRMGLHTCEVELRDGDYYGSAVNRAARLMSAAHGGQVVVSLATSELVRDADWELVDLGDHRLADLARSERVFQLVVPDTPSEFPPLRSLDALPGNLPLQLTSFVGREREVKSTLALLDDRRIVTLTGIGGVGKTRLALQVAAEALPQFRHGAWVVELAQVREPAAVDEAVAAVFGLKAPPGEDARRPLLDSLRGKQLLLVVDNCEHVLAPTSSLVIELAQECPSVIILATSREALGVAGEHVIGVASLAVPPTTDPVAVMSSESGRLFVERATAVSSDFELTEKNADAVMEVVTRLDGIPLAIELAAARVGVLSPSQIAQRLDQRFRLLAGGARGAIERHATLRAAVDWSFDLLDAAEQRLLARLSIFAGGCTLDAAEAVCADDAIAPYDVLDLLSTLVGRSLVVADDSDPAEHRYRLLETIRQYAEEHLDPTDRDALRERHASYYTEFAEQALGRVRGPQPSEWLTRLELETENLRTTAARAVATGNGALLERLILALDDPVFWFPVAQALYGFADEIGELGQRAPREHPLFLGVAAHVANERGDAGGAERLLDQMRASAPEYTPRLETWNNMIRSNLALSRGDVPTAITYISAAAAAADHYDAYEHAWLLCSLAGFRSMIGEVDAAADDAERGLLIARSMENPILAMYALGQSAFTLASRDHERARALLVECASLQRALGDRYVDDVNFVVTAVVGAFVDEAEITCRAAAVVLDRGVTANPLVLAPMLEAVGSCLADRAPEDAAVVQGAVDALAPGMRDWGMYGEIREQTTAKIAALMTPEMIDRLHARGAAMTLDDARSFVAELIERVAGDLAPATTQ
jgi:predicted ATPase/class 3 adenylate cyclase